MTLEQKIINEIKEVLKEKNISQAELAKRIGKHPQSLNRNFIKPEAMSLQTLSRIYKELGISHAIYNSNDINAKIKFK